MRALLCTSFVLCVFGNALCGTLPSYIKPCSASDPNLSECIRKVIVAAGPRFADGVPALGIEPMDPVQLGRININNPALKIVFADTVVTGLKTFRLNNFKINPESRKVLIDFTANCTLKAHYTIDGNILFLPIRGDGPGKIKITNLNIIVKYDYDVVRDAAGVEHWNITDYKDTYKMDRAAFKFQNLFGGNNDGLSNTVHAVVNEGWQVVMNDIAPPAIEQIISVCVKFVGKFFAAVPLADMLLP